MIRHATKPLDLFAPGQARPAVIFPRHYDFHFLYNDTDDQQYDLQNHSTHPLTEWYDIALLCVVWTQYARSSGDSRCLRS